MADAARPMSLQALLHTSELPVLVDFYAEWCGPCRMMAPVVERIAAEFKGRLLTVKVNVDRKPQVAADYQVTSVPTLMLVRKGDVLMRHSGALPYEVLKSEIERHIA
ncbi:MAG: thioredoxin [candidate division KSB1 bacterium]|nr:thioredoxin [candidate division KSB1 bacterium]